MRSTLEKSSNITRSASLTDLLGKQEESSSRASYIYGSPQKVHQEESLWNHHYGHETIDHYDDATANSSINLNNSSASKNWNWLTNNSPRESQPLGSSSVSHSVTYPPPDGTENMDAPRSTRKIVVRPRYLNHLETLLPQYCKHLSHPTYQEAASAMSLLLNSPPPATTLMRTETSGTDSSPDTPGRLARPPDRKPPKQKSQTSIFLSSPFRKRKPVRNKSEAQKDDSRRWSTTLSSGGSRYRNMRAQSSLSSVGSTDKSNATKVTATAISNRLDEAAWQDYVAPLVLLAGAEAVYADLEHVHPPTIIPWSGLYQRLSNELREMLPPEEKESVLSPASTPHDQTAPTVPQYLMTPPRSPHMLLTNLSPSANPMSPLARVHSTAVVASGSLPSPKTPIMTNVVSPAPPENPETPQYKGLRSLATWLDLKRKWVPFHESLYVTWSTDNLLFLRAFATALPPLVPVGAESGQDPKQTANADDQDSSYPLVEALTQEIQATLALMEMAFALERGRFLEAVVSAKKVKDQLVTINHKETAMMMWMMITFQDYLSIMPLVFDKVHTFATPLYKFDQNILLQATKSERTFQTKKSMVDLDEKVIDFLRRHEKAGGTAMAVAIVLDTDGLEDRDEESQTPRDGTVRSVPGSHPPPRIELGLALHHQSQKNHGGGKQSTSPRSTTVPPQQEGTNNVGTPTDGMKTASLQPRAKQWQATYIRSTTRLHSRAGSATNSVGIVSAMRRAATGSRSGTMDPGSPSPRHGSGTMSSSTRPSWSSERASPRPKHRHSNSQRLVSSPGNVFEYEAESSNRPSWPHSEFKHLSLLLDGMTAGTGSANIVTDRSETNESPLKGGEAGCFLEEPLAVTFLPDGVDSSIPETASLSTASTLFDSTGSGGLFSTDLHKQLWDPSVAALSLTGGRGEHAPSNDHAPTTFHAVYLTNYMWMIVMVKGEEESRWHRRKVRGVPDGEIRAFLNEMAPKLRISNRFLGLKTCQTARVKVKDSLAPRVRGRDLGLREAQWQTGNPEEDDQVVEEVLQLIKEAFSVNSVSPLMNRAESILTTMSGGFRPVSRSRSPRDRSRNLALQRMSGPYAQSSDYREGAAEFFMGPELFRQFLESTNE